MISTFFPNAKNDKPLSLAFSLSCSSGVVWKRIFFPSFAYPGSVFPWSLFCPPIHIRDENIPFSKYNLPISPLRSTSLNPASANQNTPCSNPRNNRSFRSGKMKPRRKWRPEITRIRLCYPETNIYPSLEVLAGAAKALPAGIREDRANIRTETLATPQKTVVWGSFSSLLSWFSWQFQEFIFGSCYQPW